MIILPEYSMKQLMTQIVTATHSLQDELGDPVVMSTITEPQMRMAALIAIQIATGQTVWGGDRPVQIKRPRQQNPVFISE